MVPQYSGLRVGRLGAGIVGEDERTGARLVLPDGVIRVQHLRSVHLRQEAVAEILRPAGGEGVHFNHQGVGVRGDESVDVVVGGAAPAVLAGDVDAAGQAAGGVGRDKLARLEADVGVAGPHHSPADGEAQSQGIGPGPALGQLARQILLGGVPHRAGEIVLAGAAGAVHLDVTDEQFSMYGAPHTRVT